MYRLPTKSSKIKLRIRIIETRKIKSEKHAIHQFKKFICDFRTKTLRTRYTKKYFRRVLFF